MKLPLMMTHDLNSDKVAKPASRVSGNTCQQPPPHHFNLLPTLPILHLPLSKEKSAQPQPDGSMLARAQRVGK